MLHRREVVLDLVDITDRREIERSLERRALSTR